MFGNPGSANPHGDTYNATLSRVMQDYWTSFAEHARPEPKSDLPEWPQWIPRLSPEGWRVGTAMNLSDTVAPFEMGKYHHEAMSFSDLPKATTVVSNHTAIPDHYLAWRPNGVTCGRTLCMAVSMILMPSTSALTITRSPTCRSLMATMARDHRIRRTALRRPPAVRPYRYACAVRN